MSYEDAVSELYRAPHEGFVAQRTRLSVELKAAGDNAGGARLAKLRRPPLSAWVVNQLWWQAREAFEELFASAQLLRGGDLAAGAAHRKAVNGLVARAGTLLEAAGHPANEATLRRVTATLAALAAAGSFDPDPPGALSSDRDPPGFGAAGFDLAPPSPASKPRAVPGAQEAKRREEAEQREQAESAAERRWSKEQRTQRQAERHRFEVALRAAKREGDAQSSKIERLGRELAAAEESLKNERARIEQIEARLSELETQD